MNRDALLELAKEDEKIKNISQTYGHARNLYERSMMAMGYRSQTEESITNTENTTLNYDETGSPEISID